MISNFPTLHSIAEGCGVSHVTVSRALRGQSNVRPDTAERIRRYADEVGYKPNLIARSFAKGRSSEISLRGIRSVVIPYHTHKRMTDTCGLFWDYVEGALETFHAAALPVEIVGFGELKSEFESIRSRVEDDRVAGILDFNLQGETIDYLVSKNVPMVSMISSILTVDPRRKAYVYSDHISGFLKAWRYLLDLGHARFAFAGLDGYSGTQAHLEECLAASRLLNPPPQIEKCVFLSDAESPTTSRKEILKAFGKWRKGAWPSVIICSTDLVANRLINALRMEGLAVPDDISIMGFDDSHAARFSTPPITTLANPRREMGTAMAQMLGNMIAGRPGSRSQIQVVPMNLTIRNTICNLGK